MSILERLRELVEAPETCQLTDEQAAELFISALPALLRVVEAARVVNEHGVGLGCCLHGLTDALAALHQSEETNER